MAEAESAVDVDLGRVVHLQPEVGDGLRDEAVAEEGKADRQPVPYEASTSVRVERERHEREEDGARREHPAAVDRAERREERKDERDGGEAAAQPDSAGLLGRLAGVEEGSEPVEGLQEDPNRRHQVVCLLRSRRALPRARRRPRIHQATSA